MNTHLNTGFHALSDERVIYHKAQAKSPLDLVNGAVFQIMVRDAEGTMLEANKLEVLSVDINKGYFLAKVLSGKDEGQVTQQFMADYGLVPYDFKGRKDQGHQDYMIVNHNDDNHGKWNARNWMIKESTSDD